MAPYGYKGQHLVKHPRVTFAVVTSKNPQLTRGYLSLEQAVAAARDFRRLGIYGAVIYEVRPIYRVVTRRIGNRHERIVVPVRSGVL